MTTMQGMTPREGAFFKEGHHQALIAIEQYSLGEITIGRLSEILGHSPPIVREIIVRAGDIMSNRKSSEERKP